MSPFCTDLLRHKRLKLLALGLASVAWYAIQGIINAEREIKDVPLQIETDADWAVLDASDATVAVTFRGAQEDLLRLNRDQVAVMVKVRSPSDTGAVDVDVTLRPEDVRVSTAARIIRLRPSQVRLVLDRRGKKTVPVKAAFSGQPGPGFVIERFECKPAVVTLSGPEASLRELDQLRVTPINLDGRVRSFRTLESVVLPSDVLDVEIEPNRISVEIIMAERSASRQFSDVPLRLLTRPEEAQRVAIKPLHVAVEVVGQPEDLDALRVGEVVAFVELSGLDAAEYELPVRVSLPKGLRVSTIVPAAVQVVLSMPRREEEAILLKGRVPTVNNERGVQE